MKTGTKRNLIALGVLVPILFLGLIVRYFQIFRADKIAFIIWDNENHNGASLSEDQLKNYITECGGVVNTDSQIWHVTYSKFFMKKEWKFKYSEPKEEPR